MHRLKILLFIPCVLSIAATSLPAESMVRWRPIRIGAGGFVTGIDIHRSGSPMLARTDVGGAYRWDEADQQWENVVTAENLPEGFLGYFNYTGVSSIVSAPTDPRRCYLAFEGKLLHSNDGGEHWQIGDMPSSPKMEVNARLGRLQGERLAVDPANADVVYYGSNRDGLWRSADGGKRWVVVPTEQIPVGIEEKKGSPGVGTICFDRSSGTVEGRTKVLYVTVWGRGVYQSRDAGRRWQQIADYPGVEDTDISDDGTYVVADAKSQKAYQYRDGNWTKLSPRKDRAWQDIKISGDGRTILLFGGGNRGANQNFRSLDGGKTWESIEHAELVANDIPWLATEKFFSTGEVAFDPRNPNRIWMAQGVGVWYCDNYRTATKLKWVSQSAGIEELVVNDIVVPEAGHPLIANWDRAIFRSEDLDQFPKTYLPTAAFNACWDLATMASNPKFVAGVVQSQGNNPHQGAALSGYSTDAGRTWTPFAFTDFPFDVQDVHHQTYGNLMVSSSNPDSMIWCTQEIGVWNKDQSQQTPGRFLTTQDRGATWKDVESPEPGDSWFGVYYKSKEVLAADPNDGNVFHAFNPESRSIYRSEDAGKSFQFRGKLKTGDITNCKLRTHPKRSGHLYFASGFNNHQGVDHTSPLLESRDAGVSWSVVADTQGVIDVAFGAPRPGSDEPTLYACGKIGDQYGVFQSHNDGADWRRISGLYPMGIAAKQSAFAADPGIYGQIYIGTKGTGAFVGVLTPNQNNSNRKMTDANGT